MLGSVVEPLSQRFVLLSFDDCHRQEGPSAAGTGFSGWIYEIRYPADNTIIRTASDKYPCAEMNAVAVNK
jgi:hypothetical protein